MVFEHVGAETFRLALVPQARRPTGDLRGNLGTDDDLNLMQLFQQQYRIIGSFGASMRNIHEVLPRWRPASRR